MTYQGNDTDKIKANAKQDPQQYNLFEGGTRPSQYVEKERWPAADPAFFTLMPEGILMSSIQLTEKLALSYLIKQAYFQRSTTDIKISNSVFMKVLSIAKHSNFYPHMDLLISQGYITKRIVPYKEGSITSYALNIEKIQYDFGFRVDDIYKKWNNN